MSTTSIIFHLQSFLILCVLGLGLVFRRNRKRHVPLMILGMVWDFILILQIELFRNALFKASHFPENSLILNVHIVLAVTTLFFYGGCIYTGRHLLADNFSLRRYHRLIGLCAITLRVLTFITGLLNSIVI